MADIQKEVLLKIVEEYATLEADKKEIMENTKLMLDKYSFEYKVDKKVLKKTIKEYLKYVEDAAQYLVEDRETDQLLQKLIGDLK